MKYVIATAIVLMLAIGVMVIGPRWANAQGSDRCGPRSAFVKVLNDKHKEISTDMGLSGETSLLEVFQSPGGATWTILVNQPNGISCMIAAGKNWMRKPLALEGTDS